MPIFASRGIIKQIIKGKAVVNIGTLENEVLTPPIEWSKMAAGSISIQRVPSIDERVLLINAGDGTCLSDMVITAYLSSPDFPTPNTTPDLYSIKAAGFTQSFDTDGNYLTTAVSVKLTAKNYVIDAAVNILKSLVVAAINFLSHVHQDNGKGTKTGTPE